jgi:hypothetical protein
MPSRRAVLTRPTVTLWASALALPSPWLPSSRKSLRSHGSRIGLFALFTVALMLNLALPVLLTMRILSGPKQSSSLDPQLPFKLHSPEEVASPGSRTILFLWTAGAQRIFLPSTLWQPSASVPSDSNSKFGTPQSNNNTKRIVCLPDARVLVKGPLDQQQGEGKGVPWKPPWPYSPDLQLLSMHFYQNTGFRQTYANVHFPELLPSQNCVVQDCSVPTYSHSRSAHSGIALPRVASFPEMPTLALLVPLVLQFQKCSIQICSLLTCSYFRFAHSRFALSP